MNESSHSIDRFVGRDVPEQDVEALERYIERGVVSNEVEELKKIERPMTEQEQETLQLCDHYLNEKRAALGLEEYHYPESMIHVVDEKNWPTQDRPGMLSATEQYIALKRGPSLLQFAKTLVHELVHGHSFQSLELQPNSRYRARRTGYTIGSSQNPSLLFRPLNEAVTERMAKEFIISNRTTPLFADEFMRLDMVRDHFYPDPNIATEKFDDVLEAHVSYRSEAEDRFEGEKFGYPLARQALEVLETDLAQRFPEELGNGKIRQIIERGAFTGHLIEIGRYIEHAYGKGSFRAMSEVGTPEDFLAFVEQLVRQH